MSVINYPPQTGKYKVKIKANCDWQACDTVRLEISVGQQYHEGDKLKATIEWAEARFKNIVVLVNDTLQRYNYIFEKELYPTVAYRKAIIEGDEWIERNRNVLSGCHIVRWEEWKHCPDYNLTYDQVINLYAGNREFRQKINKSVQDIWERKKEVFGEEQRDRFFILSLQYLLEETACLALAYKAFKGVSAYPGTFLEMWSMFVDRDIDGSPEGLKNAQCMRIDFSRNKASA